MTRVAIILVVGLCLWALDHLARLVAATDAVVPPSIKPVASTSTGLLLQPPLDLSWFTRRDFEAESSTVGPGKIGKKWTTAITPLPVDSNGGAHRLTEFEVKQTMLRIRDLFDGGNAVPISDVGLISTQEDVIRKPMFNHIAAFTNPAVNAYLLVQKTAGSGQWGYFAIVQDRSTEPPVDHFAEIIGPRVKFEGASCYKCHSSGPLAVHPAREDLVSDIPLLAAINKHIANQPISEFHFPETEKAANYGEPLRLKACAQCHDPDGTRSPLFRVHSHPIRVLVDFGHMPPDHRLKPQELADLKSWLDGKP